MLRRCMTPNPHKKMNYLSEIIQGTEFGRKQNQKINYDTFLYVDRLTNNKIAVGEARNTYNQSHKESRYAHTVYAESTVKNSKKSPHITPKHKDYSQLREMQEINDCFMLMKSTKLFQMENLKNKIFTKTQDNQNNKQNHEIENILKKKKKIREFIEHHLNYVNLNEFRKYMEPSVGNDRVKLINPNILNLHKTNFNKIDKHNIEKIIEEFLNSENNNEKKQPQVMISLDDIDFPDEERLKELLLHRMYMKNKEFQYLVTPGHAKQIYSQIHTNSQNKNKSIDQKKYSQNLNSHQFNEFAQTDIPKIGIPPKTKSKKSDRKLEMKKKQLICAIESGSIYDFLFLINRWPILLQHKDQFGNNLLHIAAKQDQDNIYGLLIKKIGIDKLKQKNNCGKTPIQLAKLFGSLEIQKRNLQYQNYL